MRLEDNVLFIGLSDSEIESIIDEMGAVEEYDEDEYIFSQDETPEYLFILLDGMVSVENIDENGKRSIVNVFKDSGTIFGEVYLFLGERMYDYSARSMKKSKILKLSREFFDNIYDYEYGKIINSNMLNILSGKALYLNQKLLLLSEVKLRQKLNNFILNNMDDDMIVRLKLNREELADFLGTTRPSLSRELMKMESDGIIETEKNIIIVKNIFELKN